MFCKMISLMPQKFACPPLRYYSVSAIKTYIVWCPEGHHNVHTGFVTTSHGSENLNTTDRHTRTHEQHVDVRSLYCLLLTIPESQSLSCPYYHTVCVCPLASYVEPSDWLSRCMTSYFWRQCRFQFPTFSNKNMVDKRIFQTVATKASVTWGNSINILGLKCEIEGEGNLLSKCR